MIIMIDKLLQIIYDNHSNRIEFTRSEIGGMLYPVEGEDRRATQGLALTASKALSRARAAGDITFYSPYQSKKVIVQLTKQGVEKCMNTFHLKI